MQGHDVLFLWMLNFESHATSQLDYQTEICPGTLEEVLWSIRIPYKTSPLLKNNT